MGPPMSIEPERPPRRWSAAAWPWLSLFVGAAVATMLALTRPTTRDGDFPTIDRPTFSTFSPSAYRLAEPGDTLDRVALYLASIGVVLSATGWCRTHRLVERGASGLWGAACCLALWLAWDAATPWPTLDGWYGLGWESLLDARTPIAVRALIGLAGVALGLGVVVGLWNGRSSAIRHRRARTGWRALAITGLVLFVASRVGLPRLEPAGYWSRWANVGAEISWLAAILRALPRASEPGHMRLGGWLMRATAAVALVAAGLGSIWLHRPIDRLREIVPGRIYISGMPRPDGLAVAHRRHGFKTIINLFQEDLPGLKSPHVEAERAFASAHGINYVGSPLGAEHADAFLDETLRLAQDPAAAPILLHCHACMDRTPAWWGIYAFLIEKKPLGDVIRSIEHHRGSRPKASVTLLYNRVLAERDPARYAADPAAAALRASAEGVRDPFRDELAAARTRDRRPTSESKGERR